MSLVHRAGAPQEGDVPIAYVELVISRDGQCCWFVPACPISGCGVEHSHGGGRLPGDPRKQLGYRLSHCVSVDRRQYQLKDGPGRTLDILHQFRVQAGKAVRRCGDVIIDGFERGYRKPIDPKRLLSDADVERIFSIKDSE